jgi:hypothetical protein
MGSGQIGGSGEGENGRQAAGEDIRGEIQVGSWGASILPRSRSCPVLNARQAIPVWAPNQDEGL